jgi:hypothetical protein
MAPGSMGRRLGPDAALSCIEVCALTSVSKEMGRETSASVVSHRRKKQRIIFHSILLVAVL